MTTFYKPDPQEPDIEAGQPNTETPPGNMQAVNKYLPFVPLILPAKPSQQVPSENKGPLRLRTFASGTPNVIEHPPTHQLSAAQSPNEAEQSSNIKTRSLQPTTVRRTKQQPEIESGNIILHRSTNFFVRTTSRFGQITNPLRRRTGHTTLLPKVMPQQELRVAASDTRMMPRVAPINPVKTKAFPIPAWLEAGIVVIGLMTSLVAHAINLFNFPSYELDEGTYMASAWAILHGTLTPYPYGYGHPPLGWVQIAAWVQLTGGFFTFGNAINSGRVLMLLYAVACSLLVYLIIRRLEGSRSAALLAMVIFSLSPLSLIYQRQVFLDNIGTFWLLLSLYLLVAGNSRMLYIVSAAISFGIAILSKEIFLLFMPVMIYALWLHSTKFQRKFALLTFTYIVIAIGSSFVLLATLKGELLPVGWLDQHPHLSLLDTYLTQAQRGPNAGSFGQSWKIWTQNDLLLMAFSIAATIFNLVAGWWNRKQLLLSLAAISFWLLLVRGGVVFEFYLIPLIPFIALNAAMAINTIMNWIGRLVRLDLMRVMLIFCIIAAIIPYDLLHATNIFTQQPTSVQTSALIWIRNHIPRNAVVIINSYFYTDLHQPGGEGVGDGATYPYAHIYWNVAYDSDLHHDLLKDNWDRIDYIVTDWTMLHDINDFGGPMLIIDQALHHSILRAEFGTENNDPLGIIQIYQVMHKQPPPTVYQGCKGLLPLPRELGCLPYTFIPNDRGCRGLRPLPGERGCPPYISYT